MFIFTIPMGCQFDSKSWNIVCGKLKGLHNVTFMLLNPNAFKNWFWTLSDFTEIALWIIVMKPEMKTTFCKNVILLVLFSTLKNTELYFS